MNPQDADQINRIAAATLGGAPAPQGAPQQQAAPAAPQKPADAPTTEQEAASQAGAPQTEGDKSQQDPVTYKVKFGDQERELTEAQIAQTFERYRDLNHKHASMKPIVGLAERMMQASGARPDQLAQYMEAAAKAFTKNAQFGGNRPKGPGVAQPQQPGPNAGQPMAANLDDEFRKYEDENAISLPPGYRENMTRMQRMEQAMQSQMGMMQQMLSRMSGAAQQGAQSAQSAQADRQQVVQGTIANNLDRAQQQAGLADEDGQAFMAYAGERGYTIEDFADPDLTMAVVGDFKNHKNTPEFERLQSAMQRREAFLKTGNPSAAGGAPGGTKPQGDPTLERLASAAMQKRQG